MGSATRYDPHADWYQAFRPSLTDLEVAALRRVLGAGDGRCLDIGCGTGVAIPELKRLGWEVVGVDVSAEMLRHAQTHGVELHRVSERRSLPFQDATFDAAVSLWTHTDVDDFAAMLADAARVLRPRSPFVYVGAHPCFVGPHSRFFAAEGVPDLYPGYRQTGRYDAGPAINPEGLRVKVGATHLPLGLFLQAFLDAGLTIDHFEELGRGDYPHSLILGCRRSP